VTALEPIYGGWEGADIHYCVNLVEAIEWKIKILM